MPCLSTTYSMVFVHQAQQTEFSLILFNYSNDMWLFYSVETSW